MIDRRRQIEVLHQLKPGLLVVDIVDVEEACDVYQDARPTAYDQSDKKRRPAAGHMAKLQMRRCTTAESLGFTIPSCICKPKTAGKLCELKGGRLRGSTGQLTIARGYPPTHAPSDVSLLALEGRARTPRGTVMTHVSV